MTQAELMEPNGKALIEVREPAVNPQALVRIAIENNYDLDKLQRILDMERQWKADRAKEAFEAAMAAFKSEDIHVTKDKVNKQYNSRYTSLGNLVGSVTPFLSKYRLSARWELDQTAGIKITCVLTHELGYSKDCFITFPPDESGAKNDLQQIKSAITYGKICTFESVCGIASSDENVSDDANGAANSKLPDLQDRLANIASANPKELMRFYFESLEAAKKCGDKEAPTKLSEAKEKRKKELGL